MTKRTKRYGGFRIGDKIKHKKYGLGRVEGYLNGCIYVWFDKFDDDAGYFGQSIAPNQLINLTRIEEQEQLKKMLNELVEISQISIEISNKTLESMKEWHRLTFPPLPSPYTRDVYTTTKDF